MRFSLVKRLATAETTKAVTKRSSRLRVIESRIRLIVLCIELHDAFKRRRMKIARSVYWRRPIVVQSLAAERPVIGLMRPFDAAVPPDVRECSAFPSGL